MFTTTNLYYNIAARLYLNSGFSMIHQTTICGAHTIWFAGKNNLYVLCNCETIPEDFIPEISGEIQNMLTRGEIILKPDKICLTYVIGYELSHAMRSIMDLFSSQSKIIKASFVELPGMTLKSGNGALTKPIEDALARAEQFNQSADREWFTSIIASTYEKEKDFFDRLRRVPYFTYGIAAILLGLYVFEEVFANMRGCDLDEVLVSLGALTKELIDVGEYWRLISATTLHGHFVHYLLNAYGLIVLGALTEGFFGKRGMAFIYFISAVAGSVFSYAFTGGPSVGASGAIFGLMGSVLYMSVHSETPPRIRKRLVRRIVYAIILCAAPGILLNFFLTVTIIDNWAHFGGLTGGFISSLVYMRLFKNGKSIIGKSLAITAVCSFAACIALSVACAESTEVRRSLWKFDYHTGEISFRFPSFFQRTTAGRALHYTSRIAELEIMDGASLDEVVNEMTRAGWKTMRTENRITGTYNNMKVIVVPARKHRGVIISMMCTVQTADYLDWIPEFTAESVELNRISR